MTSCDFMLGDTADSLIYIKIRNLAISIKIVPESRSSSQVGIQISTQEFIKGFFIIARWDKICHQRCHDVKRALLCHICIIASEGLSSLIALLLLLPYTHTHTRTHEHTRTDAHIVLTGERELDVTPSPCILLRSKTTSCSTLALSAATSSSCCNIFTL